jgi:tetratricopeptide (TPR) repeat protein/tRNA A-37 threonylcarbamoyl transferase component Bud32
MALIGEQLAGEYEVVEALGHGATSVVYRAVRITDSKNFAVKVLHASLVSREGTLKRFEQEARAAMLLSHPNIVRVHAINRTAEGQPFLIMDYLEGINLGKLIASPELDLRRSWRLFIQIADAMSHAHGHGVVHRSLKPGNIILVTDSEGAEQAMVSDFGLAKLLPASGQEIQDLTAKGAVIGSPLYMSPEQCLGRTIDERADIYSMGCLMYALVSGKPPLKGDHIIETMSKHVSEVPPVFDKVCPERKIPADIQAIIFKCLAKRPEERYQSMEQLKEDLICHQEGRPPSVQAGAASAAKVQGKDESLPDDRYLKPALAVILVLLAGLVAFAAWKGIEHRKFVGQPGFLRSQSERRTVHPISSLVLIKQADELSLMNRNEQARALYREAILKAADRDREQSPVDNEVLATAHFGLASLYKKLFQWSDAEKELRMALYVQGLSSPGAAPGKDRISIDLAECLMHQGKLEECKQLLNDLKRQTADIFLKARADLMLADLSRMSKKDDEAERYELAALDILKGQRGFARREYCMVLSDYANRLLEQKQFARCDELLASAISERPASEWDEYDADTSVFLTVELARAFACRGEYKKAREVCRTMLDTIKDNSLSLSKAGVNIPDTGLLTETNAVLLAMGGDAVGAEKSLAAEPLVLKGDRLGGIATMARIMIYNRQALEALSFLCRYREEALKQTASKAEFHVLTALALMQQDKNTEALSEVDQAIIVLRSTSNEALHRYCLRVKCQVLRQLKRGEAAEVIEKTTGRPNPVGAAFDALMPDYSRRAI